MWQRTLLPDAGEVGLPGEICASWYETNWRVIGPAYFEPR
jgi:hypothetical protein